MIFDDLVVTTKSLTELKKKTDLKNNKDLQNNTDARYRNVLDQTSAFVETLVYLYDIINIDKNIVILTEALNLLENLEAVIDNGFASRDKVLEVEKSLKTLQNDMKIEWAKQFSKITSATISTLDAVKGIDPVNTQNCIQKIKKAESWNTEVNNFKMMNMGLESANGLISNLGLDDEIIQFLKKINSGVATLKDLNEKVISWINHEKLSDSKIKITFIKN